MIKSFGLDLAGYSTKGSALALAESMTPRCTVTILDGHPFAVAADGNDTLGEIIKKELEHLKLLMRTAHLYVDVPIDLQSLPCLANAALVWQLTKRPADRAFGGLCPLADRIGSYVARMQNLWRHLKIGGADPLGATLFETYPAESLRLSKNCCEGYKGHAVRDECKWVGAPAKEKSDQKKNDTLAQLLNQLAWEAESGFCVSNDEFDAAICALTGIGEQLRDKALTEEINRRLKGHEFAAPKGYVLLKQVHAGIKLLRDCVNSQVSPLKEIPEVKAATPN